MCELIGGNPRSGFTILELMIAIGVMLVGLAAAFSGQISTTSLIQQSRDRQLALGYVEGVAESVATLPTGDLPEHPDYGDGLVVPGTDSSGLPNLEVVCTYPDWDVGKPVPNPLEVVITATWTDRSRRTSTLRVATLVAQ